MKQNLGRDVRFFNARPFPLYRQLWRAPNLKMLHADGVKSRF